MIKELNFMSKMPEIKDIYKLCLSKERTTTEKVKKYSRLIRFLDCDVLDFLDNLDNCNISILPKIFSCSVSTYEEYIDALNILLFLDFDILIDFLVMFKYKFPNATLDNEELNLKLSKIKYCETCNIDFALVNNGCLFYLKYKIRSRINIYMKYMNNKNKSKCIEDRMVKNIKDYIYDLLKLFKNHDNQYTLKFLLQCILGN